MDLFKEKYESFLSEFEKGRKMVLSTSLNDHVSSRMMSIVCIDGLFYFQTDKTFQKYNQLIGNPNVALCADNIQITGVCKELGHPMENALFCNVYKACFSGSFSMYSALKNERLFEVTPKHVERWKYIDSEPFIETFDIDKQEYTLTKYDGAYMRK